MAAKKQISTFVFLDLESTSLPSPAKAPSITELCFVAVHRLALLDNSKIRVLNKLNLCVNPMKPICSGSSNITGLYNDNLEHQKDFDDGMVDLLISFIRRLDPPVCLLAHNGKRFDFGLLRSELQAIGKTFPDDVFCADTLEAFMALDGLSPKNLKPQPINDAVLHSLDRSRTTPSTRNHSSPCINVENVNQPDFVSKQNNFSQAHVPARYNTEVENVKRKLFTSKDEDHLPVAPKRQRPPDFLISGKKSEVDKVKRKLFCDESDDDSTNLVTSSITTDLSSKELTPPNGKILPESNSVPSITEPVVNSLLVTNDGAEASSSTHDHVAHTASTHTVIPSTDANIHTPDNTKKSDVQTTSSNPLFPTPKSAEKSRVSYSLRELHKRITSEYPKDTHLAEADCMSLLNIVHRKASDLLVWFDQHAEPFNSMDYMYTPNARKCLDAGMFPYQFN